MRRWAVAVSAGLALLLVGLAPWLWFASDFVGPRDWLSGDFAAFHAAATMIDAGAGSQIYDLDAIAAAERLAAGHAVGDSGILPYFNPPFFALALSPMSDLSLQTAYRWWSIVSLVWLAVDAWLVWRISAGLRPEHRLVIVAGYLALFSVTYGLRLGQFSLLLQASWSAAFLCLRAGRRGLAGAALSPVLIKPELLVPVTLFLIWRKQWRAVSVLGAITLAAVAVSLMASGPASALAYPAFLLDSTSWVASGNTPDAMFGWNGIIAASSTAGASLRNGLAALLGLLTLGFAAITWRGRTPGRDSGFPAQWLALTIATMLMDPHFYYQDTVLLVPGAVGVLAAGDARERVWIAAGTMVAWAGVQLALYSNQAWNFNLLGALAVLVLVWLSVRDRRSRRSNAPGGSRTIAARSPEAHSL